MDLRHTFVLANDFKEGDLPVGGTVDALLRTDARRLLEALRVSEIVPARFVNDGVTEALERSLNAQAQIDISALTIANVKKILLGPGCADWVRRYRSGLRERAGSSAGI